MAHYSLLNNDDRGDIETFMGSHVQCETCHAEDVVNIEDAIGDPQRAIYHKLG